MNVAAAEVINVAAVGVVNVDIGAVITVATVVVVNIAVFNVAVVNIAAVAGISVVACVNVAAVAAISVVAIAVVNDDVVAAISVVAVFCYIIRLRWSVPLPQSGRIVWIFVLFGKISPKVGQITNINTIKLEFLHGKRYKYLHMIANTIQTYIDINAISSRRRVIDKLSPRKREVYHLMCS